jgi:hypothetical protein
MRIRDARKLDTRQRWVAVRPHQKRQARPALRPRCARRDGPECCDCRQGDCRCTHADHTSHARENTAWLPPDQVLETSSRRFFMVVLPPADASIRRVGRTAQRWRTPAVGNQGEALRAGCADEAVEAV